MVVNAVIGFVQEGKAGAALEAIRGMMPRAMTGPRPRLQCRRQLLVDDMHGQQLGVMLLCVMRIAGLNSIKTATPNSTAKGDNTQRAIEKLPATSKRCHVFIGVNACTYYCSPC